MTTVDKDSKTHTYSLDSADFEIVGNQLKSLKSFDFENKSSYDITISTKDSDGKIFIKKFTITINDINENPTDISLSKNNINENNSTSAVIGDLSTTDLTVGDVFTYSLVAGSGADDNASFEIDGNNLKAKIIFDYENKSSYTIRIQTSDKAGNTFQKAFTININDVDESPPTDIALSSSSISENAVSGTVVGNLSSTDATSGDSHTYTLVAGNGADDNANFEIDGNKLKNKTVFDFETKSSYKIRIKTTDNTGGSFQKAFTITINDMGIVFAPYAFNTGTKYIEATANDGSIDNSQFIIVTISEDTFVGNANTALTVNTHYTVANVPAGLTMVVTKLTATTAKITFTGKATSHVRSSIKDDSVNNVTITFKAAAFTKATDLSSVTGKSKNDIGIEYTYLPPSFSYGYTGGVSSFYENDNGEIQGASVGTAGNLYVLRITVQDGKFITDNDGIVLLVSNTHFTAKNIPDGLTIKAAVHHLADGSSYIQVGFDGNATAHAASDNVNNISITLKSAVLQGSPDLSSATTKSKNDIAITFDAKFLIYGSGGAGAKLLSDGKPYYIVSKTTGNPDSGPIISIAIAQDTWVNQTFTLNTHYSIAGLPAGLSLSITRVSDAVLAAILSGTATSHAVSDSTDITITFLNAAVSSGDASDIAFGNAQEVGITFE